MKCFTFCFSVSAVTSGLIFTSQLIVFVLLTSLLLVLFPMFWNPFTPIKKICQLNRVFGKFLQFSVSLRQFPINKTNLLLWFTTFFWGGDGCSLIQSPSTMQEKKPQPSLIRQEVSEITNWHRYKRLTDKQKYQKYYKLLQLIKFL